MRINPPTEEFPWDDLRKIFRGCQWMARYRMVKTRPESAKTNSTLKRYLWKSAFSEGVCHFERQFQVDGYVARNRSMDRWIAEWCSYNFAAGRFHTKKLCSTLFSTEVKFYWHKQRYRVFVPPFGGLRGNVHGSSISRWKARGRLPIGDNWNFFASYCGWGANYEPILVEISLFERGVGHFERKFQE